MLKKKLMQLGWLALGLGGLIAAAQSRPAVAAPCCSTCEPRYETCTAACAPGDFKCQLACTDRLNACDRQCSPSC